MKEIGKGSSCWVCVKITHGVNVVVEKEQVKIYEMLTNSNLAICIVAMC